jgi:sulfur carrier protein ThiS
MKIFIEKNNRHISIRKAKGCTAADILHDLKINPATVIIVKNNEVVLEDEILDEKDYVKILSVISGG